MTVADYLDGPEEQNRMELLWGRMVREPAPRWDHQGAVKATTLILDRHVREHSLGVVGVSPIDVVLDRDKGLILQPDVLFISNNRRHIIDGQVWGPPDLVVEVLSRRTANHDRTIKARLYREYGVRECWLLDHDAFDVTVLNWAGTTGSRTFSGDDLVVSSVFPELKETAGQLFG